MVELQGHNWEGLGEGLTGELGSVLVASFPPAGAGMSLGDGGTGALDSNQRVAGEQTPVDFASDAGDSSVIQTKLFKRRRRATATLIDAAGSVATLPPKCCDRCKSDLNGKLMVRCATCAFRRHLYCFVPPLKQHPAFLIHQQHSISPSKSTDPPIWKCEKCEGTAVVFNINPRPSSAMESLPRKTRNSPTKKPVDGGDDPQREQSLQLQAKHRNPRLMALAGETEASWPQEVHPQWVENSGVAFDWYRFRAEKTKVLRHRDSICSQSLEKTDELVFYSRAYALMKKTAAFWRSHVQKQQRFHRQRELEVQSMQNPGAKLNVMHVLRPGDADKLEATQRRLCEEQEEAEWILDDAEHYEFRSYTRRPPRLPRLWEGEPPSALVCWTPDERLEVAELLVEMEERVCLTSEDIRITAVEDRVHLDDAEAVVEGDFQRGEDTAGPSNDAETAIEFDSQREEIATELPNEAGAVVEADSQRDEVMRQLSNNHPTMLELHRAVEIIRRVFVCHQRQRRRVDRAKRQRRAIEELARRAKAQSAIALLRLCIQFIVLVMKLLGQAQQKKALLLVLRDAAEETQAKTSSMSSINHASEHDITIKLEPQRMQQLAKIRIRRFFVRRVYPYVQLKKRVMARRLQRWWKHSVLTHRFREVALVTRLAHRNQACTRIQRLYRRLRTRGKFGVLVEKHTLSKLRLLLRGWMFSRLAKKESHRCTVYDLALSLGVAGDQLTRNASVSAMLEAVGLGFYRLGDFWNAASMLERLWTLKKGLVPRDLQLTLAYAHHMTWYSSYDPFNLSRAHDLYCTALEAAADRGRHTVLDPLVLQDLAIVLMQLERFSGSLRLLAKLVELFARRPEFPLWLLLAAVQLQQLGQWEQSVSYLTYLHDIPPAPYLERDILALCAIGYERMAAVEAGGSAGRYSCSTFAKEAWRAALRQWNLEKATGETGRDLHLQGAGGDGRAFTARQKWELLLNFGLRALEHGHYLLACRVYLYALERQGPSAGQASANEVSSSYSCLYQQESRTAWWNLADAFRHLGHIDLYLNAAQRSQGITSEKQAETTAATDAELLESWRTLADSQVRSFQDELKSLTVLEKLQQLTGT
ncbi:hypothetical protein BBJ28_00003862 [Nothophytophthora sp. Chile5]|nr:hypothetical protein BBJ28_00003862 [Nothophytophthora sp. Chile5]